MIFGKGRNLEGWGIFFILANWPIFFPASSLPRYSAALRLPRCCASLRLPTLGYTFDFPFYHGAIARVFTPAHVALRAAFGRQCWFASPRMSHPSGCLCSLPRNRPVAWFPASARWHVFRFPVSGFRFQVSGFRFPVSSFQFPVSGFCPPLFFGVKIPPSILPLRALRVLGGQIPAPKKLAKWPGCQNRHWAYEKGPPIQFLSF